MGEKLDEGYVLKIKKIIAEYTDVDLKDIHMESKLTYDLGLTSFDFACLTGALEQELNFKIDNAGLKNVTTVEDVYKLLLK